MAYAYVVRGSEDGNIGVYSSKKKALKRAVDYVTQQGDEHTIDKYQWVTYVASEWSTADVEKFILE